MRPVLSLEDVVAQVATKQSQRCPHLLQSPARGVHVGVGKIVVQCRAHVVQALANDSL